MGFKIISPITDMAVIARGTGIRKETRDGLRRRYGPGNWRKMKGRAQVRLQNSRIRRVEVHWYEANGIGPKDYKIKRYLD